MSQSPEHERKAVTGLSPVNAASNAVAAAVKDMKMLPEPTADPLIKAWKNRFAATLKNARALDGRKAAAEADAKATVADFKRRAASLARIMNDDATDAGAGDVKGDANKPKWLKKLESNAEVKRCLEHAQSSYKWAPLSDGYPPHMTPDLPLCEEHLVTTLFGLEGVYTVLVSKFDTNSPASNVRFKSISDFPKKPWHNDGTIGSQFADDWWSDEHFGAMRMFGPNPMVITRAKTADDIPNALNYKRNGNIERAWSECGFRSTFADDLKSGRVFVCDYAPLGLAAAPAAETAQDGTPASIADRWMPVPIVVLYLKDAQTLIPAFIQIDQRPESVSFTRPQQQSALTQWGWRWAKTCVNAADWLYHELGFHLCFTHLVEEVLIVSSRRTLPDHHPVMLLLAQHYTKTLALNKLARDTLVPDVLALAGPVNEATEIKIVKNLYDTMWHYQNRYVPADLQHRNLTGVEMDLYGAWASKAWAAIQNYVDSVIRGFYASDDEVKADAYLKAWHTEVEQSGQMKGFPELDTRDKVRDAVTMAIYTATYQHSAVNYQQYFYMGYSPSMSGSMYGIQPKTQAAADAITQDDLVRALPPKEYANLEAGIVWVLSQAPDEDDAMINSFTDLTCVYSKAPNGGTKTDKWTDAIKLALKGINAAVNEYVDKHDKRSASSVAMKTAYKPKRNAASIEI